MFIGESKLSLLGSVNEFVAEFFSLFETKFSFQFLFSLSLQSSFFVVPLFGICRFFADDIFL